MFDGRGRGCRSLCTLSIIGGGFGLFVNGVGRCLVLVIGGCRLELVCVVWCCLVVDWR